MQIREATLLDIPVLIEMVYQYKYNQYPLIDESIKVILSHLFKDAINQTNSFVYVYQDDREILNGYINFHIIFFPMISGKEIYVSELLVVDNKRGMGIGSNLLERVELFGKNNGCKRIMLNNLKNTDSYVKGFYKKHNFVERDNVSNFIKVLD